MPNEPMRWGELQRTAERALDCAPDYDLMRARLHDLVNRIDAAAPAMEEQERTIAALGELGRLLRQSNDIDERVTARDSAAALARVVWDRSTKLAAMEAKGT